MLQEELGCPAVLMPGAVSVWADAVDRVDVELACESALVPPRGESASVGMRPGIPDEASEEACRLDAVGQVAAVGERVERLTSPPHPAQESVRVFLAAVRFE